MILAGGQSKNPIFRMTGWSMGSKAYERSSPTYRRRVVGLVVLVTAFAVVAFMAPSASAARSYESQITGFSLPSAVTTDASGNIWVTDPGNRGLITEYGPYPSHTKLSEQTGGGHFTGGGSYINSLAINNASGDLYVGDSEAVKIDIFDNKGAFTTQLGPYNGAYVHVAVDNSSAASAGRIYAAIANDQEAGVEVFGPTGEPIDFEASAPYIRGNALTETPENGSFNTPGNYLNYVWNIAVDDQGNIYVVAQNPGAIYEYAPTGEFVQTFKDPEGSGQYPTGVAIDPTNGNVLVVDGNAIYEFTSTGEYLGQITGTPSGPFAELSGGIAVGPNGRLFVVDAGSQVVDEFGPAPIIPSIEYEAPTNPTPTSGTLNATVDPNGGGEVTECVFEYGPTTAYGSTIPCSPDPNSHPPESNFATATHVSAELSELITEETYHYRIVAADTDSGTKLGPDRTYTPHHVVGLTTEPATDVATSSATLNASFVGNGEETHYYFEWGTTSEYGNKTPLTDAGTVPTGQSSSLSADLSGLTKIATYHYRVVAENGVGTSLGEDKTFETLPASPLLSHELVTNLHSESAEISAEINPGGGITKYHFEYGTSSCAAVPDPCTSVPVPDGSAGSGSAFKAFSADLPSLSPGITYHWRIIATNVAGSNAKELTFTTFSVGNGEDLCPNSHVRQQTGSSLLPDCRAYELVSAATGLDVESSLIQGQTPYPDYPEAEDPPRVLYTVGSGSIPGTGNPTGHGLDPYVATRTEEGWTTEYVGIPSDDPFAAAPFSSVPTGASSSLDTFVFGGEGSCSPCFEGGYTGIPVRLPGGELVQGMVAASNVTPPGPAARPDGYVAQDLSANGQHLIFGSTAKFAEGGNDGTGDVSFYDRDLVTGETHVVSDSPTGSPLACMQGAGMCDSAKGDKNGISELAISADGSRVLLGQKVSEEVEGRVYWRLYLDIDDATRSVELTPGATDGVLFDGMTEDGSRVFFTTKDRLATATNQDTDESPDIYDAEVPSTGQLSLTRVSVGEGTGNTDVCDPVESSEREHWNAVGSETNCGAVAIGGGGGVASKSGTIYFLSPEQLQRGEGIVGRPNLYVAQPGSAPEFVATLSPDDSVVLDAVAEADTRHTADFQITPSGQFAIFATTESPTEYENAGHSEVYRYDAADSGTLDCASCAPTNAVAVSNASLAPDGLSLTDDGRVFFDSSDPLSLRDTDGHEDVYEWETQGTGTCQPENPNFFAVTDTCLGLISTGTSPYDSSLLGVSANGADAFFFTRDSLVPQDESGSHVKIYDSRELGGFPYVPPSPPCRASDECHGAGSPPPPPPDVHANMGSTGNVQAEKSMPEKCKKGYSLAHHKCVKQHHKRKRQVRHKRDVRHKRHVRHGGHGHD